METSNSSVKVVERWFQQIARFIFVCLILVPAIQFFLKWPPSFATIFSEEIVLALNSTLKQASISALLSVLLGATLGILCVRSCRVSVIMKSILKVSFCLPGSLAALTWLSILPAKVAFSYFGIVLVHVWLNAPWIALRCIETLEWTNRSTQDAANALGGRFLRIFFLLDFPRLNETLFIQFFQTFIFCCCSFSVIMILGSGSGIQSLETSMFESLRYGISNWSDVSNLAILQGLISITVGLVLIRRIKLHHEITDRILSKPYTQSTTAKLIPLFLIGVLGLPYCITILKGAAHIGIVMTHLDSCIRSLVLAISSATVAIALSIIFILGNNYRLPSLISLVSVSFLSISWIVMLSKWLDPFADPMLLIPVIQGIIFFPFAFYILRPLKQSSQVQSLLAARALGAGLVRSFFWIEGRRWKNAILSTWLMIAGLSLGEMTTVSFFSLQDPLPLILQIRDLKAHYEFDAANGLLAALLVLSLLLLLIGEYLIIEKK